MGSVVSDSVARLFAAHPELLTPVLRIVHLVITGFLFKQTGLKRIDAYQRNELERLCRYITRPAIANERLSRNRKGQVVLRLKSPYRDGTTHIVMSALEFTCLPAGRCSAGWSWYRARGYT